MFEEALLRFLDFGETEGLASVQLGPEAAAVEEVGVHVATGDAGPLVGRPDVQPGGQGAVLLGGAVNRGFEVGLGLELRNDTF